MGSVVLQGVMPLRLGTALAAWHPCVGTHGTPLWETGSGHGPHPTAQRRGHGRCSFSLSSPGCARRCGLCKRREPCVMVLRPRGWAAVGARRHPYAQEHPCPGSTPARSSPACLFLAFGAAGRMLWGLVAVCFWIERLEQGCGPPSQAGEGWCTWNGLTGICA